MKTPGIAKTTTRATVATSNLADAFVRQFPPGRIDGDTSRVYLLGGRKREFFTRDLGVPAGLLPFESGARRPTYFDRGPVFVEGAPGQVDRIVFTYLDTGDTKPDDHFKRYKPLLRRLQAYSAAADARGCDVDIRMFIVTFRESILLSAADAFWSVHLNPQHTETEVHRYFDTRRQKQVARNPYLDHLYALLQRDSAGRTVREEILAPLDLAFGPALFACVVSPTAGPLPCVTQLRPRAPLSTFIRRRKWLDWGALADEAFRAPTGLQ